MDVCVYYEEKKGYIIDISPQQIKPELKAAVEEMWAQPIARKVLIAISQGLTRLPDIQKQIGHSASTLHEAVKKLDAAGLISYEMIYKGNKQKELRSKVLCVSKNPKSRAAVQKFFQGLWIDSRKTKKVVDTMQSKDKWWTPEELSLATKIPVDEITLLLSNFDSQTTRGLSQFLKEPPFEKKVMFKAKS